VVAPKATRKVRSWAHARKIDWQKRDFRLADLRGTFVVIAATSSARLHERIFRGAKRLGVLCNVVDVPRLCDFYYPAVVRRGPLQIAISTAGQSPALAQRLRKELEGQFGPEYKKWLNSIGEARKAMHGKNLDPAERKRLLHELASREAFETFRRRGEKSRQPRRKP
jgi:precorrin-2 dehydrogenase/sirohydrochlorin ferrochelatase